MRAVPLLAVLLLFGCDSKEKIYSKYVTEVYRANLAYAGSDAAAAYAAKMRFVEYVERLQADHAQIDIPYTDIYIWENARLGLLAEHLGKREESKRYFGIAVDYAKKRYPNGGGVDPSEAGLRSALDQMDTPDNFAWRRK
jgi:hypothetical protein